MTVRELIAFLKTQPPELPVVYECHSEYDTLTTDKINVSRLQTARPDGWVANDWNEPALATVEYLIFPG